MSETNTECWSDYSSTTVVGSVLFKVHILCFKAYKPEKIRLINQRTRFRKWCVVNAVTPISQSRDEVSRLGYISSEELTCADEPQSLGVLQSGGLKNHSKVKQ